MILIPLIPLALVLSLMFIGQWTGVAQTAPACGDFALQERMRVLMYEGIDNAFTENIGNLHATWMRDGTAQPQRAALGVTRAVDAYAHARKAVADWKLKPC